ncbi:aminoglycoside phosphotransferase family protein [Aeromonas caviae]|uniref:aminoglycoside phosphotransferase family protein n=1 Tax=Aeromonas TaxID=642 RepID=UPI0018A610F1|nr:MULTISPECIES: phosphotransferase [Aeromonas]MEB6605042.1 phosphotransferase [Aeromonas sanarellii]BCM77003.1 aminoglycoside phosphotransferase [Aeromonas caviae]GJA51641.1 aminoglycoside phosphotransferase [Aeromonas caviae]GJA59361.1 aminoglycoside phosphotransferase [Aeromonas caviae]GJA69536.1 aminoglycoside phosphotransferase [Aeromonas caviae]
MHDRASLLLQWARRISGDANLPLTLISGDASFRRYFRGGGLVWVDANPKTEKNHEFVRNAAALHAVGLLAPEVRAVDYEQGLLAVTDLGDTQLIGCLNDDNVLAWYGKAIALLPRLGAVALALEPFDEAFMARENSIFPEWLLGHHLQLTLSAQEEQLLAETFACLTANNLAQPQGVMHRDFHSRNLMVCGGQTPGESELAIIDFQDMVTGPLSYDLVSLLKDCYVRWPDEVIEQGMGHGFEVLSQAGLLGGLDYASFRRHADLTGMQRHLKAAGIFTRLCHRDGKSSYLKDIPRTLGYVVDVCRSHGATYPVLARFGQWLEQVVLPGLARTGVAS